jgi:hypothetical protein
MPECGYAIGVLTQGASRRARGTTTIVWELTGRGTAKVSAR